MANTPTATSATNNTPMAEIAAFSKKVRRMLGLSLHGWENWMVGSLIFAAAFALIAGFSTWAVVRLQRIELADSKMEFDKYKLTVEGQVADAKKEGVRAGENAGNALVRAAALEKQAAELKAANLALEAKVAPRRLSGDQKSKISTALSGAIPLPVAVVSRLLDFEGKDFAEDLASALEKSQWTVTRNGSWTQSEKGVFIALVEPKPEQLALASTLSAALDDANIVHKIIPIKTENLGSISPHFQPNVLYLLIRAKP
jgi:hypothetical protein